MSSREPEMPGSMSTFRTHSLQGLKVGDIAGLAELLLSMHKALGWIPSTAYIYVQWCMPIILAPEMQKQENQKFKVIL